MILSLKEICYIEYVTAIFSLLISYKIVGTFWILNYFSSGN